MATLKLPAGEKVSAGLAWLAWIAALLGGFAATSSWIGDVVANTLGVGPWYVTFIAGVVGFLLVIGDLFEDGVPDRLRTIYITLLWPSTWLSMEGKAGKALNGWIDDINAVLDKKVGPWVQDNPTAKGTLLTGFAAIFCSFALVWGHRYASKRRAAASASTTSTVAPAVAGRRAGRRS